MTVLNLFRRPAKTEQPDLSELLDSLGDAVLVFNSLLEIKYVNACWKTLTGYSSKEAIHSSFSDYIHPEDLKNWIEITQQISHTLDSQCIWFRLIRKDSEVRWCEIRLQPLKSDRPFPLTATLCDITPQVRNDEISKASHRSLSGLVNRIPGMLYRVNSAVVMIHPHQRHSVSLSQSRSPRVQISISGPSPTSTRAIPDNPGRSKRSTCRGSTSPAFISRRASTIKRV